MDLSREVLILQLKRNLNNVMGTSMPFENLIRVFIFLFEFRMSFFILFYLAL